MCSRDLGRDDCLFSRIAFWMVNLRVVRERRINGERAPVSMAPVCAYPFSPSIFPDEFFPCVRHFDRVQVAGVCDEPVPDGFRLPSFNPPVCVFSVRAEAHLRIYSPGGREVVVVRMIENYDMRHIVASVNLIPEIGPDRALLDRKSTRLNSSHANI